MDIGLDGFSFAKNWIPKLAAKLVSIRKEREKEMNQLAATFGDPQSLARHYVEPDCQQFNPADYEETETIVREPIFRRIESFISGDAGRSNRQLFVLSDAGMGKTSALLMLKLSHMSSFWPTGYDCVLMKLGPETLNLVSAIEDKRNTVLLLDALDEDPQAWRRVTDRIRELLAATGVFRRVIITCRTQFFTAQHDPFNRRGQVEVAGFLCSVVYASLFTDQQVRQYIEKAFPKSVRTTDWTRRVSGIVASMGFLRMRPMLLSHLDDLLQSAETRWNEYSVYRALVDVWLLREQGKVSGGDLDYAKQIRAHCRNAAVRMMTTGRLYFTGKETNVLNDMARAATGKDGIDLGGRSLLNKDSDGNYRFSHFSIQEFLVTEYLLGAGKGRVSIDATALMNKMCTAWIKQAPQEIRRARVLDAFDFSEQNFDDEDLSGINFSGCHLSGASFNRSNLSNASLAGATMRGTSFVEATLANVDAKNGRFNQATFVRSSVVNVDFHAATLIGVNFFDAQMQGCNLSDITYDDATQWPRGAQVDLSSAVNVDRLKKA